MTSARPETETETETPNRNPQKRRPETRVNRKPASTETLRQSEPEPTAVSRQANKGK
jgi:hypothetical protein